MRILITDNNFQDDAAVERRAVESAAVEVITAACRTEDDVIAALERYRPTAVLVQFAPVGDRAIAAAAGVRAVVRYGIGVDNIDTRAAEAAGIAVGRVPDYCIDEVADHSLALLLAVNRGIVELAGQTTVGGWDFRVAAPVRRLRGQILGLIGFGRIARALADRAAALGMRVVATDPGVADADVRAAGAHPLPLDELLACADVLSLHAPLTDETRGLIGRRELAMLPAGAIVLNTSRGGLVDEDALAEAVASGHLRGAGVDVLEHEPAAADHPLRSTPGVVLTPHAAWYSESAVVDLREKAVATALHLAVERPGAEAVSS